MTKVFGKLKEEPFALLPPTIFFFVAIYCTMHELVPVISRQKVLRIFFGADAYPSSSSDALYTAKEASMKGGLQGSKVMRIALLRGRGASTGESRKTR